MANWVRNRVRAKNKEDAQKLIDILVKDVSGKNKTNFNGVIPMPDAIRNTTAPNHNKELAAELKKAYGYEDWYSWACNVWGTKWDNLDVTIGQNGEIEFDSAWSIPEGVYGKISETIPIIVAYADEDIGYNCGVMCFDEEGRNDIPIKGTDAQIANAVWGYYSEEAEEEYKDNYSESVQEIVDNTMTYPEQ